MWMLSLSSTIFLASLYKFSNSTTQPFSLLYHCLKTLPRDLWFLYTMFIWNIKLLYRKVRHLSAIDDFRANKNKTPNRDALIGLNGTTYTFQQLEDYSNQVSNFLLSKGHSNEKVIILIMENCPEYIALWLGIAKCGIITALQNYNLSGEQLSNCLKSSEAKTIIVSSKYYQCSLVNLDLSDYVVYIYDVPSNAQTTTTTTTLITINDEIIKQSKQPIDYIPNSSIKKPEFDDILFYIYTSGTTGLPKPVKVSYRKAYTFASAGEFLGTLPSDRIYTFLPLYHINSGVVCVMLCFLNGASLVIREKFSATNLTKDCIKYKANGFNYVGEICRYLMNTPVQQEEKNLKLRVVFGNGLRENIWNDFATRYHIDLIGEFYGSTEGNVAFMNASNKAGACGFLPLWTKPLIPYCIVKCDLATGEIIKDDNGHCIVCNIGEPGHIIGQITKLLTLSNVDGYTNEEATKAKLIRNVFRDGDVYFLTGDIMRQDEEAYFYFVDRVGDTFRWKGENISTQELENIIIKQLQNHDVVVYGVEVPGNEGKAGMLTLVDKDNQITLSSIYNAVSNMPSYQRPLFVRISHQYHITTTFKFNKVHLKKEAFNPHVVSDKLFYLDQKNKIYRPLTNEIYDDIVNCRIDF